MVNQPGSAVADVWDRIPKVELHCHVEGTVRATTVVELARKAGRPLPSGTVITMVIYKAKLGADGQPEKDANGRFIKTGEIAGIAVMEKRMGWGAEYPPDMRNGEWEYRAFKADGTVNDKADLKPCFTCHLQKVSKQDFVFSLEKLKAAAAK